MQRHLPNYHNMLSISYANRQKLTYLQPNVKIWHFLCQDNTKTCQSCQKSLQEGAKIAESLKTIVKKMLIKTNEPL